MMPPADATGDGYGPKFPSRDGSETRAGEDFFGNLSGVEGGTVDDQEAASSSPALNESGGESGCVHAWCYHVWVRTLFGAFVTAKHLTSTLPAATGGRKPHTPRTEILLVAHASQHFRACYRQCLFLYVNWKEDTYLYDGCINECVSAQRNE